VHVVSWYGLTRYAPGVNVMDLSQGAGMVLGLKPKNPEGLIINVISN
jgi:hypothetical protein